MIRVSRFGISIVVEKIARHRNGVMGAPFHVVTFKHRVEGRKSSPFVAVVFDEPHHIAVIERDMLAYGVIEFATNSWRGDEFEPALREAIEQWEAAETARLMPQIEAQRG